MKRNFNEISDGKLYGLNDMVKADCMDCVGCSSCCHGMGDSIVLDPLDIYELTKGTGKRFEELLVDQIDLHVIEGVIIPKLRMVGESEHCAFLNEKGRCSIHAYRPGICRIFPLGRYYEDNSFQYFLQVHECKKQNRAKVKVSKWIDIKDLKKNQTFISDWHYFLKNVREEMKEMLKDADASTEQKVKKQNMFLLNLFFVTPYQSERDFYEQFYERFEMIKKTRQVNAMAD